MIESSANRQIKRIAKLQRNARFRRREKCFVAEGWKMAEEAVRHGLAQCVYVSEDAEEEWRERANGGVAGGGRLDSGNALKDMPVEVVSPALFRELSETVSPQGILVLVAMPQYEMETMLTGESASMLLLEDIQDPGNLGTMFRTAEGAGMSGVILSRGCVDLFNPKTVRSAMGALFRVPYAVTDEMTTTVELLKQKEFTIYAAHLEGERDYASESYQGRTGILIGNEANGLSDPVSRRADRLVKIPMEGELESLNAAVSAALLMYEVHRRR